VKQQQQQQQQQEEEERFLLMMVVDLLYFSGRWASAALWVVGALFVQEQRLLL